MHNLSIVITDLKPAVSAYPGDLAPVLCLQWLFQWVDRELET